MSDLVGIPKDRFSRDAVHYGVLSRPAKKKVLKLIEPRHEKTNILHMRKQRRRSASR